MDCTLFLSSNLYGEVFKTRIYEVVRNTIEGNVSSSENFSRLSYKYFTLYIETEDIISIDFLKKEYDMEINSEIRIQLFGNYFEEGLDVLFKIFGNILVDFNPNLIFIENGTDQIFRKEDDTVIINTNLDQYQKAYLSNERIASLQFPYIFWEL